MVKTVAIIGGGPAGLVSAKEALASGLIPTVFEKQNEVGGVWNPQTGSTWPTMCTNISKYNVCFGDTPHSPEQEMFLPTREMYNYLLKYLEKWGLGKYLRFQSEVKAVVANPMKSENANKKLGSAGWTVSWSSREGESETILSERFDSVIIATGIFTKPNIPNIKGLEDFRKSGIVIHSKDYKSPEQFRNKRVLIIGGSLSGVEIASNVVSECAQSLHTFRRPFWILKKFVVLPTGKSIPFDLLLFSRKMHNEKLTMGDEELNILMNNFLMTLCSEQQQIESLKVPQEEFNKPINSNISDRYLEYVANGEILVERQQIKEISGNVVVFEVDNGSKREIDAIILATGFTADVSFFQKEVLDIISYQPEDITLPMLLFEGTVHPQISNLFFVGVAKQPWYATMEQQARWAGKVLSGQVSLPFKEEMERGLEKAREVREAQTKSQFPYGDLTFWTDRIAKYNGSLPELEDLSVESFQKVFSRKIVNGKQENSGKEMQEQDVFVEKPYLAAHYDFHDKPAMVLEIMDKVGRVVV